MKRIRNELAVYGRRLARADLVAGAGGNISAREGARIWIKPSGFAMEALRPDDLCGIDLETGRRLEGSHHRPTSELHLHLEIYRRRPDVAAIFHTHPPWTLGVLNALTSGPEPPAWRPMFPEEIWDLGRVCVIPYAVPGSPELAEAVASVAPEHDVLLLVNHGAVALGATIRQAYFRSLLLEHAAKARVAAAALGTPHYLTADQIRSLDGLDGAEKRKRILEGKGDSGETG